MQNFAAFLGIDWADAKHDLCLIEADSGRREFFTIKHSLESLDQFLAKLRARFPNQVIAVGLEQSRGPLIFALLKYNFLVLWSKR